MSKLLQGAIAFVLAASLVLVGRCSGRSEGTADAERDRLVAQIRADSINLAGALERARQADSAKSQAIAIAAAATERAAKQKRISDSLDRRVRILNDSQVSIDGEAPVAVPPVVLRNLAELRVTNALQDRALIAKDAVIAGQQLEIASLKKAVGFATSLASHQGARADLAENARPPWWQRLGGAAFTATCSAGGAVVGAFVGGPVGAAVGAAAGATLAHIALPR